MSSIVGPAASRSSALEPFGRIDLPTVSDLGSEISWHRYEGCDAPVEFYDFVGMGHTVPLHDCGGEFLFCSEYEEFDFWETATEFFDNNPLPG